MDNLGYKYNRILILILSVSPILSYFTDEFLHVELKYILILMSYLGVVLILVFKNKRIQIRIPKYLFFYFLYTLYEYYAAFVFLDRDFHIKYLYGSNLFGAISLMFIIENIPISKKYYNIIYKLSKNILIIAFFVILYQELIDGSFLMIQNEKIDSSFLGPKSEYRLKSIYSYLGYLTFGLGFLPILLWVIESLDKKKKNTLIWISIGFIYIFIAKARWLMVNSITILIILIINHKNKVNQIIKYSIFLIFLFFVGFNTLNYLGIDSKEIVEQRILEKERGSLKESSAGTRIFAFKVFSKVFLDHPFFGVGDHKYGMGGTGKHDYKLRSILGARSAQIHVGYLSLFYKFGIIGGFLFLGFLFNLLKILYKTGKTKKIWSPFLGVLGFALVNFTQVTFSFFELGLIIVLVVNKFYSQDQEGLIKKVQYA